MCYVLQRDNKRLGDEVLRLQRENDDLAEELVSSKVALRVDMDSVSDMMPGHHTECVCVSLGWVTLSFLSSLVGGKDRHT